MSLASGWSIALSVQLLLIGLAYAVGREWAHAGYYVSAAVLNTFVFFMRGSNE